MKHLRLFSNPAMDDMADFGQLVIQTLLLYLLQLLYYMQISWVLPPSMV